MKHRIGNSVGLFVLLFLVLHTLPSRAGERQEVLAASLQRAVDWLRTVRIDPFTGGILPFRIYTVEVETWHRLWALETDPERREGLRGELVSRLEEILDPVRFEELMAGPEAREAFTEAAILAVRCTTHGLDPVPITRALQGRREALLEEIGNAPPSIQALYAVLLPPIGIDPGLSPDRVRREGMLARRPREVDLTMADIYYLTHEIYARTDYALEPLAGLSPEESIWLLRVLPFYTLFYLALDRLDIAAELVTCLHAAGMGDTFAYREGIRGIVESQNADGSFGAPASRTLGGPVEAADLLHPTMNCVTALALELAPW